MPEIHKVWGAVVMVIDIVMLAGLFMVNPNEGRVLQLFGKYVGTAKDGRFTLGKSILCQDDEFPCACATSRPIVSK